MIIQAIETRYLSATNTKGGRIKATAWAGSVTVPYSHELNVEDNHYAAAEALKVKFGWQGRYVQGSNAKGDGYVFVHAAAVTAASDLLAALETLLPVAARSFGALTADLDAARAAIAKAKGE